MYNACKNLVIPFYPPSSMLNFPQVQSPPSYLYPSPFSSTSTPSSTNARKSLTSLIHTYRTHTS